MGAPFDFSRLVDEGVIAAFEHHGELFSTSDRALELARSEPLPPLPMLIVADEQTAGRGRGGSRWWAGRGALTFTLLLEALSDGGPNWLSVAPLAMARAILDAAASVVGPNADSLWIKWPNDLYVGDRKVAGILTEAVVSPSGARLVSIGVGVNLGNESAEAPAELSDVVVSLSELRGQPLTASEHAAILSSTLTGFIKWWSGADHEIDLGPPSPLLGKAVRLQAADGEVRGEYMGVDDAGALLLRVEGRLERIVSGEGLRLDDQTS